MNMNTHIYHFGIRVLIYEEDGQICAHALEMDVLGYGKTEKRAISDLSEGIKSQISFARLKSDDTLLPFPAPKEFYERWEAAHAETFKNQIRQDIADTMNIKAVWMDIGEEFNNVPATRFKLMEASCA
jgi:hypothetical protein